MKEQMDVVKRIELLTNLLNVRVAQPKFTEQKIKGRMEWVPTGSFDTSPLTENEIATLKALIFMDVNEHIDNGRIKAKSEELNKAKQEQVAELLKKSEEEVKGESEHQINQG